MNIEIKHLLIASLLLVSCSNGNTNSPSKKDSAPSPKPIYMIRIDKPIGGFTVTRGEIVNVTFALTDTIKPDSIILRVNGKSRGLVGNLKAEAKTSDLPLGSNKIGATAWYNGQRQTAEINIIVKSDITPKTFTYKVIKEYPHDPKAYTQGLFISNNILYEGTGQPGASSLRKVNLQTGKVIQSINISDEYFGEGIALINGEIFQLTWTSGIGFVYDAENFSRLHSFNYNTQGWGLTTDGNLLIMSDGSNVIHFMEPQGFSEVKRIEVYDSNGPVKMLNELEYINGKIYANVYLTDKIVIIDPTSGAVVGNINMAGLLKQADRTGNEDVLNGIAYNPDNGKIYLTGKYWPKLFEVKFIERK